MANQLASETSPYLLQHKDNPVAWRPWGAEALEEAARTDKPIFVSVGYAACHWCHVMAHESFEDAEAAALMNDLYVCVKVDREERPDIDGWLQTALSVLGAGGGWPLSAFLTPKGEVFWAGTYFPKEESFGRPAFKTVLKDIAQRFREDPKIADSNIQQIGAVMERAWSQNRSGNLDPALIERIAVGTAQRYDIFFGGMTGAQKFLNVPSLETVWRGYLRSGAPQYIQVAMTTLEAICRGGIFDHLGGGFSRYATDDRWLVPHFEKMLYDNAAMIDILTLVWQNTRHPLFQARIEETINWVLRDMRMEGGAFAAALDADTNGEEGKFYVWTETEIDAALVGTMGSRFKQAYGVTKEGNFPGGRNVLHRILPLQTSEADEALFTRQRELLLEARNKRVKPQRDDKILADWNGMMIAALANAGSVFRRPDWVDAAKRAFAFVKDNMSDGEKLLHTNSKKKQIGFSDDYANMARAALTLWEMTGDASYMEAAKNWVRVLDEDFWQKERGGYAFAPERGEPIHVKIRTAFDTQTPSANGIMVGVLGRLFFTTGDGVYGERVSQLINAFAGDAPASFIQLATFLNNFEFCASALQIVVIGPNNDTRTHDLIAAVLGRSLPNRLLIAIEPGGVLPVGHPAQGQAMQNGQPTAYICQAQTCSTPVTSAVMLSQVLQLPQQPRVPQTQPMQAANA